MKKFFFERPRRALAAVLTACALLAAAAAAPAMAQHDAISVSGTSLTRGGKSWVPRGFTLIGLVAPEGRRTGPFFEKAAAAFGPQLLKKAADYGADTIRLQVSQPGLDPQSPIYDPAYLTTVLKGVTLARGMGLAVILSMQSQGPSGLPGAPERPTEATMRAWSALAPHVRGDAGVMLEVFNEPGPKIPTPQNWRAWQAGQQMAVDGVRALGANNTLIVDGLRAGHFLNPSYTIRDPLGKLVYGIHPYLNKDYDEPSEWSAAFGDFAASHPVLATEWNALGRWGFICSPAFPDQAQELIDFLAARKIGLIAWALDGDGTVLRANGQPTSFDQLSCGEGSVSGAGAQILQSFSGRAKGH